MTLLGFLRHRVQFREVVSQNGGGMTIRRYFRLMLLCISEMICTIPIGAYNIYINTAGVNLAPWISWADTHANFSHVEMVPAFLWRRNRPFLISVVMGEWVYVFAVVLFFGLFGFADEAKKHYKIVFWSIMKLFGVRPKPKSHKMQFNKLAGYNSSKPSPYSPDFHALPPYSPPPIPYTPRKITDSLSLSPSDTFSSIDLESGIDAGLPSLHSDSATDYQESDRGALTISDARSLATPPSPVEALRPHPSAVVPLYHRPFSPPPTPSGLTPAPRKGSSGSISIVVHTQSTTF